MDEAGYKEAKERKQECEAVVEHLMVIFVLMIVVAAR